VTGVVGSSPERAAAKAKAENLPDPYPSLEALLEDERVDVVHLATPNHVHHEQVRAVLDAGKHVVCEKPLAMTSTQTGDLLARATQSGLVHAVNFNQRFYPQNLHARAVIAEGSLGDVRLISGGYMQDWCCSRPTGAGAWSASRAVTCASSATSARTGWT
jgi:predicted dehydrogenase